MSYRANPRPETQLQKRPAPEPSWPLRASVARRVLAWCTGRLRALENRQILRMPATRAYELAETSDRMWRRVTRLRPNIYAEIQEEHNEDYRLRLDAWERERFAERDGRRAPKPVPLPGPPMRYTE